MTQVERVLQTSLRRLASTFPAVTITGPRQSGKTTLCRMCFPDHAYVNLEAPDVREQAQTDPRGLLAGLGAAAILDEIQRVPELLSYLQLDIDAAPRPGRFVLTGSSNMALMSSVSQSLAGRTAILRLLPPSHDELQRFAHPPSSLLEHLTQGSFPAIAALGHQPMDWLRGYVATYVERDVRQILNIGDLVTFQRFMALVAGRTAQLVNYADLAADAGIDQKTAKKWLSVLETSHLVLRLPSWHTNLASRQVKAPKLHLADSGLACFLLGIHEPGHLESHPLRGAIFESWVVSEVHKQRLNRGLDARLHFVRDHRKREVDLLLDDARRLVLAEVKSGQTVARSFLRSLELVSEQASARDPELRVERRLVYGGAERKQWLGVDVLPWDRVSAVDW